MKRVLAMVADHPVKFALGLLTSVLTLAAIVYSLVEGVSLLDGLWWGVVTATTVGYGDISPKTIEMRIVAACVMATGVATVAILTATLAAKIVSVRIEAANDTHDLDDDFDHVIAVVESLKQKYVVDEEHDDQLAAVVRDTLLDLDKGLSADVACAKLREVMASHNEREGFQVK
jgi:voltage-gated potassium channel Kch